MAGDPEGALRRGVGLLFEAGCLGGWGDGALIERFVVRRDEEAFAAIVERHGPMVLGVCRAVVGNEHEAHDAFQATFLVLVKRARSLWVRETIGPWLHGVAWRVARRARAAGVRRRMHERRAAEMASRPVEGAGPGRGEAEAMIHDEVNRLPERFRATVVLCDLEGLTTDQAAARLGSPVGTVRSRLARGRDRLRARLIRRGIAPAAGIAVALAQASAGVIVPASLAAATVKVAVDFAGVGTVSAHLACLMKGGEGLMSIKGLAAVGIAVGLVAGVGGLAAQGPGDGPAKGQGRAEIRTAKAAAPEVSQPEPTKPDEPTPGPAEIVARDQARLNGSWSVLKVMQNGKEVEESKFSLAAVAIGAGRIQIAALGEGTSQVSYRIDPRSRPSAMRIAYLDNLQTPPSWWLYAFEGDTLRLAFDEDRTTHRRPPGFDVMDAAHPFTVLELVRDANSPAPALPVSVKEKPTPKADAVDDLAKLQGTWAVVAEEQDGVEGEPNVAAKIVIAGNAWITTISGKAENQTTVWTFTLDPSKEPRTINMVEAGALKSHTSLGIYRVDGPNLMICFDSTGAKRPAEFDTQPGTSHHLTILRRPKPAGERPKAAEVQTKP